MVVLQRPTSPTAGSTRDERATWASRILLLDDLLHPQFVARIEVGEEQVDGDRFDSVGFEVGHGLPRVVVAERHQDLSLEVQALVDLGHQVTRSQGPRIVAPEAEELGGGGLLVAAQVRLGHVQKGETVAVPLGGDGPGLRARARGDDVGRQCGAENDGLGRGEELRQRHAHLCRQPRDALHHPDPGVRGSAVGFRRPHLVGVAEKDAVGERAAAVDGYPVALAHPLLHDSILRVSAVVHASAGPPVCQ